MSARPTEFFGAAALRLRKQVAAATLLLLTAVMTTGCSSGGSGPGPTAVACSETRPCPSGLVCLLDRGLCAVPISDLPDLTGESKDLAGMPPADMTGMLGAKSAPGQSRGDEDVATPFLFSNGGSVEMRPGRSPEQAMDCGGAGFAV